MTNTPSSSLDAMMAQYEKNNTPTYTKNENSVAFDTKNYFGTFLDPKEKTKTKKVRILPTSDGSSPFVEMHGHKRQVEGSWKTFACLKTEKNEDCPFCEARDLLLATKQEKDKELAKDYSTRKMYIVKLIDRDAEEEGVKFWRFNHDYRKTGILDKIFGVLQVAKDITDVNIGRDLQIQIGRDQNNKPVVQSIVGFDASPLSTDAAKVAEWTTDTKVWQDVYSVKPYAYLEIIVKGGVPAWDKELNKFVDKATTAIKETEKLDSELTLGVSNVKTSVTPVATEVKKPTASVTASPTASVTASPVDTANDDDDLPF